jgi:hypothetical protein
MTENFRSAKVGERCENEIAEKKKVGAPKEFCPLLTFILSALS